MSAAGPDSPALQWFEFEVCPHKLRVAVIPGQPVLFGYAPEGAARGTTYLLSATEHPTEIGRLASELANLLDATGVLSAISEHPERAFADAFMTIPSIHLRVRKSGRQFQAYWELGTAPPEIREFCERARKVTAELVASLPQCQISGPDALRLLRPRSRWRYLLAAMVLAVVGGLVWFIMWFAGWLYEVLGSILNSTC